jgi:mRNA-degrading endonuclease RelE of RelBE toxin-antitoxin system
MGLKESPDVQAFIRVLAPKAKQDIRAALDLIRKDPFHKGLDWKPLRKKGAARYLRARVGDYRIIYSPRPGTTYVWRVQHRREGYEWLDRFDPWT